MLPRRRHGKSPAWINERTLPFEHDQRVATSATRRHAGSRVATSATTPLPCVMRSLNIEVEWIRVTAFPAVRTPFHKVYLSREPFRSAEFTFDQPPQQPQRNAAQRFRFLLVRPGGEGAVRHCFPSRPQDTNQANIDLRRTSSAGPVETMAHRQTRSDDKTKTHPINIHLERHRRRSFPSRRVRYHLVSPLQQHRECP